jgi:hypothetical protein
MNDVLYSYLPESNDRLYLWLGLVIAIGTFGLSYWLLKKPAKGRAHTSNALVAMLVFFMGLLAATTAFFSGWSAYKQGKIEIYADHLTYGNTDIPYANVRKFSLKKDETTGLLGQAGREVTTFFLVIETKDGKTYAISDKSYPINEIRANLNTILQPNQD